MDGATFLPFSYTIAPRCRVSLQRADSLYAAFSRDFTTPSFAHTPLARLHNMFEPIARTILAGTQHTAQGKFNEGELGHHIPQSVTVSQSVLSTCSRQIHNQEITSHREKCDLLKFALMHIVNLKNYQPKKSCYPKLIVET